MDWKDYVNDPYNIELRENAEILDKIDLLGYCKAGRSVVDIMNKVEDDYNCSEQTDNCICRGCILNWFSEADFVEYLKSRYPGLTIGERETASLEYYIQGPSECSHRLR